jgi:DNA-binding MarR family transcriptional regulator
MKGPDVTESKRSSAVGADIKEATVLQILRVADLLTRIGDAQVFGKALTQAQFNVLMVLQRQGTRGGISQKDILEKLVSSKGNVSIHITNLSRMGYVRKRTSKRDSRMNVITLTAAGKRILDELEPKYVAHLEEITGDLSDKDAETVTGILSHLQERCNSALKGSPASPSGGHCP